MDEHLHALTTSVLPELDDTAMGNADLKRHPMLTPAFIRTGGRQRPRKTSDLEFKALYAERQQIEQERAAADPEYKPTEWNYPVDLNRMQHDPSFYGLPAGPN